MVSLVFLFFYSRRWKNAMIAATCDSIIIVENVLFDFIWNRMCEVK